MRCANIVAAQVKLFARRIFVLQQLQQCVTVRRFQPHAADPRARHLHLLRQPLRLLLHVAHQLQSQTVPVKPESLVRVGDNQRGMMNSPSCHVIFSFLCQL